MSMRQQWNTRVIEKSATGYGASVPDLPGCVAVAKTEAGVRKLIREGIEIYLDETRRDGSPIPAPTARVEYVQVDQTAVTVQQVGRVSRVKTLLTLLTLREACSV